MQLTKLFFDVNLANCKDADPEIFFADQKEEEEYSKKKTKAALAVCSDCPVIADCLQFAIVENAIGVWGGTTTQERRILLSRGIHDRDMTIKKRASKNAKNIEGHNRLKSIEKGAKMKEQLVRAIELNDGWADDTTLALAKLKIENPDMSLTEMASATGLTRDQVAGKLRRFVRRVNDKDRITV